MSHNRFKKQVHLLVLNSLGIHIDVRDFQHHTIITAVAVKMTSFTDTALTKFMTKKKRKNASQESNTMELHSHFWSRHRQRPHL